MKDEVAIVAAYAENHLLLSEASLSEEYYYHSVPLCVIDAVYSIGVRYGGVRRVVARYCTQTGQRRIRSNRQALPSPDEQESVSSFCSWFEQLGVERVANEVFMNRQRTSPTNGILKADAVYRFASVLRKHRIEYLQNVPAVVNNEDLSRDIRKIPGQRSGISLQYFWMLAGSDEFVKPDRMIVRFLQQALGRSVTSQEAQDLLSAATVKLLPNYPQLTPRLLDFEIWMFQRLHPVRARVYG